MACLYERCCLKSRSCAVTNKLFNVSSLCISQTRMTRIARSILVHPFKASPSFRGNVAEFLDALALDWEDPLWGLAFPRKSFSPKFPLKDGEPSQYCY